MLVSDFDYDLPPESIAQEPLADRAGSRLLQLIRQPGSWHERAFRDFPNLLRPDDLLVVNNTRVFPARLYGYRSGGRAQPLSRRNPAARELLRGRIEVLLTRQVADVLSSNPEEWECLVRPGRKIGVGEKLYFDNPSGSAGDAAELEAEVIGRGSFGERRIRFSPVPDFFARVQRIGHVPLPPYIDRDDRRTDRERYQTVYAQTGEGMARSVAAPTAGLHFTPEILRQIRERGIEIAEITLHVGLGTFQPVRVENVEDHKLHRESYEISAAAAQAIKRAKAERRRVVAVGTTTVRTLEYAVGLMERKSGANSIEAGRGEADLFIYPGYRFRVVDALLTNFHLPQSTLLMLVCALGGKELVMEAYRHAVEAGFRFFSYGDCMFIE
ncbi:MAG: tRNA preQ1(34) S-adenosylmethionine ribosyltransferase-isomerase QueA [Terriglobales bacterium]|jgi:S-adenosylmethionine:tRNA ribosyltransferase-isomerase